MSIVCRVMDGLAEDWGDLRLTVSCCLSRHGRPCWGVRRGRTGEKTAEGKGAKSGRMCSSPSRALIFVILRTLLRVAFIALRVLFYTSFFVLLHVLFVFVGVLSVLVIPGRLQEIKQRLLAEILQPLAISCILPSSVAPAIVCRSLASCRRPSCIAVVRCVLLSPVTSCCRPSRLSIVSCHPSSTVASFYRVCRPSSVPSCVVLALSSSIGNREKRKQSKAGIEGKGEVRRRGESKREKRRKEGEWRDG